MKYIIIFFWILPQIGIGQQKKSWIDHYWVSANLSLLHSIEKRGSGFCIDMGRNFKSNYKLGIGYSFLQFDEITKVNVVNVYLEKSINAKNNQLFFFAKPGITLPHHIKILAANKSPYEFYEKQNGYNLQLGSGIRWKVNRHSFFLNGGYTITNFSFTAKEFLVPINPYNPFADDPINHKYKLSYSNIIVNIGFTL